MKLDEIDHKILETLQNDARLSNKELAASVGLAPSSCLERVRRLKNNGVLKGFQFHTVLKVLVLLLHFRLCWSLQILL